MSDIYHVPPQATAGPASGAVSDYAVADRGAGWLIFAGIITACANAIVHLLFIASYPFLSLALFSLSLLVIYGLVAYGGRRNA